MSEKKQLPRKRKGKKKFTKNTAIIIGIVVASIVLIVWLSDVFYGNSDNPVTWSREMPRESVAQMGMSFWNVEGYPQGIHMTMTDEMTDELYDIIHDLRRNDFARGSVTNPDVSIMITCYNAEFLLDYKGGAAGLIFDEETGNVYGGGRDWKIVSEELEAFVEKYKTKYLEELEITEE